jgi:phosphoglycerate dehydrogenase-like enzyme
MDVQTIIRLDASPYQRNSFFLKEKEVAESFGCRYLFVDAKRNGLSWPLPPEYSDPFILISNTHTNFKNLPSELLNKTKLLIHGNSGYDNFDYEDVLTWNFPVVLGNPVRVPAVSEYILSHLLSRFGLSAHQNLWEKDRQWQRELLCDQNILVIGQGLIGERVGLALTPLAQKLTYYDPYKNKGPSLKELLADHRIIILTSSLNKKNHHLLGEEELKALPSNFIIINPARGSLINESALISALKEKPKAFAVLDVFEQEPFGNQFKETENIHLTSHIAGVSKNLDQRLIEYIDNVINDFKNKSGEFENQYTDLILKNRIHDGMLI